MPERLSESLKDKKTEGQRRGQEREEEGSGSGKDVPFFTPLLQTGYSKQENEDNAPFILLLGALI